MQQQQRLAAYQPLVPFINLKTEYGGIIDFRDVRLPPSAPDPPGSTIVTHVGTSQAYTCVGVYFPIDENRCFAAHIFADTVKPTESPKGMPEPTADQGAELRDTIYAKLQSTVPKGWTPTQDVKDRAVIVCSRPGEHEMQIDGSSLLVGTKYTGAYVMEAICEFLQIEKTRFRYASGFIVGHETRRRTLIPHATPPEKEKSPNDYGFSEVLVESSGIKNDWTYVLDNGEWVPTAQAT